TFISGHLIVPAVVLFVLMGAWMSGNNIGDWYLLIAIGAIGIAMQFSGWPRPPLVLGFILGPIMENALSISLRAHDGFGFLFRPVTLVILILTVLVIAYTAWKQIARNRENKAGTAAATPGGEGAFAEPRAAVAVDLLFLAVFAFAIWQAAGWPKSVAMLPLVAAIPGAVLAFGALVRDIRALRIAALPPGRETRPEDAFNPGAALFFLLWIAAIVLATILLGQ
ncbi:unnamed protein product, partial [Laminaria digitata]